ncbi:MAG: hypothetical protein ABEN55_20905 [Bradymonadaceae bacterium]
MVGDVTDSGPEDTAPDSVADSSDSQDARSDGRADTRDGSAEEIPFKPQDECNFPEDYRCFGETLVVCSYDGDRPVNTTPEDDGEVYEIKDCDKYGGHCEKDGKEARCAGGHWHQSCSDSTCLDDRRFVGCSQKNGHGDYITNPGECPEGTTCDTYEDSGGDISIRCLAPDDETCTYDSFDERCDGDTKVQCGGGIVSRTDCSAQNAGYTCVERDGNPKLKCVDPDTYCTKDSFDHRCEGDVQVYCSFNEIRRTDCSEYADGYTCVEGDGVPESSYAWCEKQ